MQLHKATPIPSCRQPAGQVAVSWCSGQRNFSRLRAAASSATSTSDIAIKSSTQQLVSRREGLLLGLCLATAAAVTTPSAVAAAALSQPDIEQIEVCSNTAASAAYDYMGLYLDIARSCSSQWLCAKAETRQVCARHEQ
jgi:hypothetical protein